MTTTTGTGLPASAATVTATAPDGKDFRRTAGRFPTGVTVVTTLGADGHPHGTTVNSFTTVSMDPFMVLVSLGRGSRLHDHALDAWSFAVTVLAEEQQDDALWFADRTRPTGAGAFAGRAWRPAPHSGAPVLLDGVAWFDCAVAEAHPAGDHTLLLGRVHSFGVLSDRPALTFADSRFAPPGAPS
ncbi:flavin reductase family protein [Streptomyces sp. NBC_00249]|uniref:flavin reductase family protein n=1 Tax=Streptomyces sp. NBC_00249 TaxID=2975690 RepID=UPI0022558882|nr:flavin reductase family protein [Streptomyces sp. NBC_00249]MCX5195239.1 flavin reductase family protein [Streptomyces sp. NBC_00249]